MTQNLGKEVEGMPIDEAENWKDASCEEIAALQKNETWILTDFSPNKKATGRKWFPWH